MIYDSNGGSSVPAEQYNYNETVTIFPTPIKEGYSFVGWYDSRVCGNIVRSLTMTGNKTLYAHWKEAVIEYTLTFMNDSSTVEVRKVKSTETATEFPSGPSKQG